VVLDAGPLALLTFPQGHPAAGGCDRWLEGLVASGNHRGLPEIADYEVRRELRRNRRWAGLRRLDALATAPGITYLPLTTSAVRLAAEHWARVRQQGRPTADFRELDCDVVAAQARLASAQRDFIVATTNARHLALFVPAEGWSTIRAD